MRFDRHPPPYLMRYLKTVGRGINRYSMLRRNDRILLSISGGKDSLALALAMALRRRHIPIHYDLEAVLINWHQYPHPPEKLSALQDFFREIAIPLRVIDADIYPESFSGRFNCYLCGRNRRRILFEHVSGWEGRPLIATGHHLDDIVETTLMNLFFRGSFATMKPVQSFFDDRLRIIRPLCLVKEETISLITRRLNLPVSTIACPLRDQNIRSVLKPMIRELERINPQVRENIQKSHGNINHEYLPEL